MKMTYHKILPINFRSTTRKNIFNTIHLLRNYTENLRYNRNTWLIFKNFSQIFWTHIFSFQFIPRIKSLVIIFKSMSSI